MGRRPILWIIRCRRARGGLGGRKTGRSWNWWYVRYICPTVTSLQTKRTGQRRAFGSVVKAQNKTDNRVYAVKKIRLKRCRKTKIFREVNAPSVRYYTTWVETSEIASAVASEDENKEDEDEEDDGPITPPLSICHPLSYEHCQA